MRATPGVDGLDLNRLGIDAVIDHAGAVGGQAQRDGLAYGFNHSFCHDLAAVKPARLDPARRKRHMPVVHLIAVCLLLTSGLAVDEQLDLFGIGARHDVNVLATFPVPVRCQTDDRPVANPLRPVDMDGCLVEAAQVHDTEDRAVRRVFDVRRRLAVIVKTCPYKGSGDEIALINGLPGGAMRLAPRRGIVIETGRDPLGHVSGVFAARHEGAGVLGREHRLVRVRRMEWIILILLVVDADDIDRMRDVQRREQAIVHRRRYRPCGVERLDDRTHASDHLVTGLGALHRFFVEHRPQIDAGVIAVAAHQPFQLRHIVGRRIELAVLGHDKESVTVAGVHQGLVLGIVREADGVAACRFQAAQAIVDNPFRHGGADAGVVLMQTDALDLDALVIEVKSGLGVETLGAEAAIGGDFVQRHVLNVF